MVDLAMFVENFGETRIDTLRVGHVAVVSSDFRHDFRVFWVLAAECLHKLLGLSFTFLLCDTSG